MSTCIFDQQFWLGALSNTIATVIGVVLGIPVAFWINRRILAGQEKQQREREGRERQRIASRVLNSLHEEISSNKEVLDKLINELPERVVFYNLSTSAWTSTTNKMLETIDDFELIQTIATLYGEYEQIKHQIDAQFTMHYSVLVAMDDYYEIREDLIRPTTEFAKTLVTKSTDVLSKVESWVNDHPSY